MQRFSGGAVFTFAGRPVLDCGELVLKKVADTLGGSFAVSVRGSVVGLGGAPMLLGSRSRTGGGVDVGIDYPERLLTQRHVALPTPQASQRDFELMG